VPKDEDPRTAVGPNGQPLHRFIMQDATQPAIDAQGNADCQVGQTGYMKGPLHDSEVRYGMKNGQIDQQNLPESAQHDSLYPNPGSGGNWTLTAGNYPGLAGGTYVTRRLGIKNLRDVP
jgi:hypothetical protein